MSTAISLGQQVGRSEAIPRVRALGRWCSLCGRRCKGTGGGGAGFHSDPAISQLWPLCVSLDPSSPKKWMKNRLFFVGCCGFKCQPRYQSACSQQSGLCVSAVLSCNSRRPQVGGGVLQRHALPHTSINATLMLPGLCFLSFLSLFFLLCGCWREHCCC